MLSSSSISEHRRPTVLRMFLSKEPVKDSDLKVISPALFLNYSTIAIDKENLCKIGGTSEEYEKIIAELLAANNSQEMYFCKEKDIFPIAQRYLKSKEAALEFLMQLRSLSFALLTLIFIAVSIGAVFIKMYTKNIEASVKFHAKFAESNNLLLANSIAHKIEDDKLREETLSEISKDIILVKKENN